MFVITYRVTIKQAEGFGFPTFLLKGRKIMNNINQLAQNTVEKMREAGYSPVTYWRHYVDSLLPVVRFHEEQNAESFDQNIMSEYIRRIEERKENGTIGQKRRFYLLAGAERMTRIKDTEKLFWLFPKTVSKFKLNDYYQQLLDEYIAAHSDMHSNTRGDMIWVTKKFFA